MWFSGLNIYRHNAIAAAITIICYELFKTESEYYICYGLIKLCFIKNVTSHRLFKIFYEITGISKAVINRGIQTCLALSVTKEKSCPTGARLWGLIRILLDCDSAYIARYINYHPTCYNVNMYNMDDYLFSCYIAVRW